MIRVEIANGRLDPSKHEITIGEMIVKSLKGAGIPVKGFFAITAVTHGVLEYHQPHGSGNHVFTWREDEDDTAISGGAQVRSQLPNGATVYKCGRHVHAYVDEEDEEL